MFNYHLIAYYIGIFLVLSSHIYMLANPLKFLALSAMKMHAYTNLIAATLIAYYFMNREGFIMW